MLKKAKAIVHFMSGVNHGSKDISTKLHRKKHIPRKPGQKHIPIGHQKYHIPTAHPQNHIPTRPQTGEGHPVTDI